MLNRLNILANTTTIKMAVPPPITAEKKLLKKCRQMFEMKWPIRLDGAIKSEYLKGEYNG